MSLMLSTQGDIKSHFIYHSLFTLALYRNFMSDIQACLYLNVR